jgi:aminodeoxyfutalosine deaminase
LEKLRIQCQFLVVDSKRVLSNGQVVVRDNRIIGLHDRPDGPADLNLPDSVVLPGLINSHSHLEFSDMSQPLPAGDSFPEWIASVVQHRRQMTEQCRADQLLRRRQRAIVLGLIESGARGTALVADIVTRPWDPAWLTLDSIQECIDEMRAEPAVDRRFLSWLPAGVERMPSFDKIRQFLPQVISLPEILGTDPQRLKESFDWALAIHYQARAPEKPSLCREIGISPHSTYTLPVREAFDCLASLSESLITAMHVAESMDELDWLAESQGPFRRLFESLGMPTELPKMQISQAIDWLRTRRRSLLVHGNYLSASQLDSMADGRVAVVYCPRTHRHFKHTEYPLQALRDRRIPLLLGTDSLASNPDLNLWQECKIAHRLHPTWPVSEILDAVTRTPAKVLGVDSDLGSLEVGKLAWLNTVPSPPEATADSLLERLLSSDSESGLCPLPLSGFQCN